MSTKPSDGPTRWLKGFTTGANVSTQYQSVRDRQIDRRTQFPHQYRASDVRCVITAAASAALRAQTPVNDQRYTQIITSATSYSGSEFLDMNC